MTTADQAPKPRAADPCAVVIFGAAGDLTKRKLIPALFNLREYGLLPPRFAVIGVARRDLTDDAFRATMAKELREHAPTKVDEAAARDFMAHLHFVGGDFDDA